MLNLLIAVRSEEFETALRERMHGKYRIISCNDGEAALDLLNSTRPDALILDLMLPKLDGLSVLEQAEAVPPIIVCTTTYMSLPVARSAEALGVWYILLKPCSAQAVERRLDEMARRLLP